jgi:hypothetical protein
MQELEFPEKLSLSNNSSILYNPISPHPNGVECLDITSDGSHIVTISKEV